MVCHVTPMGFNVALAQLRLRDPDVVALLLAVLTILGAGIAIVVTHHG